MVMEASLLDLINYDLYVSINEYNRTQNVFNQKIRSAKRASERETAVDSSYDGVPPHYLRNRRWFRS